MLSRQLKIRALRRYMLRFTNCTGLTRMSAKISNLDVKFFLSLISFHIHKLFVSFGFERLPSIFGCYFNTKSVNQDSIIILWKVKLTTCYAKMNKNCRSTSATLKTARNTHGIHGYTD